MTLKEIVFRTSNNLKKSNFISSPGLEARIIICHVIGIDLNNYFINMNEKNITEKEHELIIKLTEYRMKGKSIASITGVQDFYDCRFLVDDNVLIPRPDTEILVEYIINLVNKKNYSKGIDIGTGPGTIAITVSKHCKNLKIDAIDISEKALNLCRKNVISNLENPESVNIFKADIFSFETSVKYDIIISNPPYIPSNTVKKILKEHIVDDPVISLDGGETGLDFYYAIKKFAKTSLVDGGVIVLEHGFDQKEAITEIFNSDGFTYKECIVDYGGNNRGSFILKNIIQ